MSYQCILFSVADGVAAGAGANIALACDLVIAAQSASFVQAFSRLGLVPDSGGTWFLPRLVGNARTKQAIYGAWERTLPEQLGIERDMQRELGWSHDHAEGVAAFTAKRAPRCIGR